MIHSFAIFVRSGSTLLGQLEQFERLDFKLLFNDGGEFSIELPYGAPNGDLLLPGRTLDVEMDGQSVFSGQIEDYAGSDDDNGDTITYTGVDETGLLARRLCLPVPGTTTGDYSSASHDIRSGAAEDVIKQYVDANAGPGARLAPVPRQIITSLEVNYGRGLVVSERARFEPLDDFIRAVAIRGGGLGWRVLNGQFQVYEPRNLSGSVIFQKPDTMQGYKYKYRSSQANFAIAGGSGSGTSRTAKETSIAEFIAVDGLKEIFVSKGDTADAPTLIQAGQDALVKNGALTSYEIVPLETERTRLLSDYWLGDTVGAIIKGVEVSALVRQIAFSIDSNGAAVTVSIGDEVYGNIFRERKRRENEAAERLIRLEII